MNDENQNAAKATEEKSEDQEKKTAAEGQGEKNEAQPDEMEMHEDIVITENEKTYESALRRIFKMKDGEELGSIEERIAALEKKNSDIIAQAKESVINAEIRALSGYDGKLLARLIDRSRLEVDENGKVQGLENAVKAVEAEFPSVKLTEKKHSPFIPINPANGGDLQTGNITMNDLIRGKR